MNLEIIFLSAYCSMASNISVIQVMRSSLEPVWSSYISGMPEVLA